MEELAPLVGAAGDAGVYQLRHERPARHDAGAAGEVAADNDSCTDDLPLLWLPTTTICGSLGTFAPAAAPPIATSASWSLLKIGRSCARESETIKDGNKYYRLWKHREVPEFSWRVRCTLPAAEGAGASEMESGSICN